jgi:hypothetical protein
LDIACKARSNPGSGNGSGLLTSRAKVLSVLCPGKTAVMCDWSQAGQWVKLCMNVLGYESVEVHSDARL